MKENEIILNRLASSLNVRNDVPNLELAKELAANKDKNAIKIIANNLRNKDKRIQSDCLKVLYETGYIDPELIKDYAGDFIRLLRSNNNRLVWGSMIALSTIAEKNADLIIKNYDFIVDRIEKGSVITVDNGIKALAKAASIKSEYNKKIFPYLIDHLKKCRPKEVAQHAESVSIAVNDGNLGEYMNTLHSRESHLTRPQLLRLKKIYKKLEL